MPSLDENISTLMQALLDKADDLIPNATPQDLALIGHAIAATRGTAALQSIIDAGTDALGDLTTAKETHIATLAAALTSHQGTLNALLTTLSGQLTTVRDSSIAQIQAVWLSVAGMRIGDITWRMFPDPSALPDTMLALVGGTVTASSYSSLVAAWGLNGGTVSPFVTRYNATKPSGEAVRVEAGLLYLPNLTGFFPQGVALADAGKYAPDMLKDHTHDSPAAPFLLANAGTGVANSAATGSVRTTASVTGNVTAASANVGAKNKPESFGGLFVVRAK